MLNDKVIPYTLSIICLSIAQVLFGLNPCIIPTHALKPATSSSAYPRRATLDPFHVFLNTLRAQISSPAIQMYATSSQPKLRS